MVEEIYVKTRKQRNASRLNFDSKKKKARFLSRFLVSSHFISRTSMPSIEESVSRSIFQLMDQGGEEESGIIKKYSWISKEFLSFSSYNSYSFI